MNAKYAFSTAERSKPTRRTKHKARNSQMAFNMTSRSNFNMKMLYKQDKHGMLQYLNKVDIVNNAKRSDNVMLLAEDSVLRRQSESCANVRFKPGEVERQLAKGLNYVNMKKHADINNYNQADNAVLQKEMKLMKEYSSLPSLNLRKSQQNFK